LSSKVVPRSSVNRVNFEVGRAVRTRRCPEPPCRKFTEQSIICDGSASSAGRETYSSIIVHTADLEPSLIELSGHHQHEQQRFFETNPDLFETDSHLVDWAFASSHTFRASRNLPE
jgi:hypothetical protein